MSGQRDFAPIYVTRPALPPLDELTPYLERIWESGFVTNGGQLHREFEQALASHLQVEHLSLFANGTLALVAALQALDLQGEVITTPYTFVATTHALHWNGLTPVFVDIDPQTGNLDAAQLEAAITPRTSAILPVHCYGHACDVGAIAEVAQRHGLNVVYDAAHAFGVTVRGSPILVHGDLAVLSFHATKVFNTFEGGAVVSRDAATKARLDRLKNFGMVDECDVPDVGLNSKMSEFNAALGLVQLRHVDRAIVRRRQIDRLYREMLREVRGIRCLESVDPAGKNSAYFPICVESGYPMSRDGLLEALKQHQIYARRYFYPLVSTLPMYAWLPTADPAHLPRAHDAAARVLCLPIHPDLEDGDVARIVEVIQSAQR